MRFITKQTHSWLDYLRPSLKALSGSTPYECICKIWTSQADRFIFNSIHQMPGLNT